MRDRLIKLGGDLKFFLWKSKKVNYRRYISIIVIGLVVAGLSFMSYKTNRVKAASAASWSENLINISGSDASFMLLNNGSGNTCLYPLNYWSAYNFNFNGTAGYIGNACTNSPGSLSVVMQDYSNLTLVGDISLSLLSVNTHSNVTTAPADARGMAVPYRARGDGFATRYTGFIKLNVPANPTYQAQGATRRGMQIAVVNSDDAGTVEVGDTLDASADSQTWTPVTYNNIGADCRYIHSSWRGTLNNDNNSCVGPYATSRGSWKTLWSEKTNGTARTLYIPIRLSSWETTGQAVFGVQYKVTETDNNFVQKGSDIISAAYIPFNDSQTTGLYPPQLAGNNVGKVDIGAPGNMRFEMANVPVGIVYDSGAWANTYVIDASLQNYYMRSGNSYNFAGTTDYGMFARVDMTHNGTFSGYAQANNTFNADKFLLVYNDPNRAVASNPFNNESRTDARDYKLGWLHVAQGTTDYKQNYKLQYHADSGSSTSGLAASLKLTVGGDLALMGRAQIQVSGQGLPGGMYNSGSASDEGMSGIGGLSRGDAGVKTPGLYDGTVIGLDNAHGWNSMPGSNWANGNGGGGGNGGKYGNAVGLGGGGGGTIGYGSAGLIYVTSSGALYSRQYGNINFFANGGGGYLGHGGGVNNSIDYTPHVVEKGLDGRSDLTSYGTLDFDSLPGGMGGGGGQASSGSGMDGSIGWGGDGGGAVKLTVGGNLSIESHSGIMVDGYGGYKNGGGGGAGSMNIKVTGTFDLSSRSYLTARGGSATNFQIDDNYTALAGNGGGGLVKVRAGSFTSSLDNANDPSAWPSAIDACSVTGRLKTSGRVYIDSGEWNDGMAFLPGFAQNGLIDLAYNSGNLFCGGSSTSLSGNLQITKVVQQLNTGSVNDWSFVNDTDHSRWRSLLTNDGIWNNNDTVVAGGTIRTIITVVNPGDDTVSGAKITDTLPYNGIGVDNGMVLVKKNNALDPGNINVSITNNSFVIDNYTLLGRTKYEFIYSSTAIQSPWGN